MGRKLNTSQPMVLGVMLAPLIESFQIIPSGATQQWYYANDNSFLPDRTTNPLVLTPTLSVVDKDTNTSYDISFNPSNVSVKWYLLTNGEFVQIPNDDTGTAFSLGYTDSVLDGSLIVNLNVMYNSPITLKCECIYVDPRRSGVRHTVSETIDLTTNRDAWQTLPTISIDKETLCHYNIFKDSSSLFTLNAKVLSGNTDITSDSSILWYVLNKSTGTETLINASTTEDDVEIPTYPAYVSGYNTSTLVLNAMYTEDITVVARIAKSSSPLELYPSKALCTIAWDNVEMDIIVHSNNSGAIRTDTVEADFEYIANIKNKTLTEDEKQEHLAVNWKMRNTASSTVVDKGWGQKINMSGNTMRQYDKTLVYVDAYIKGAYEIVTKDGTAVTYNGEPVYNRPIS